MQINRNHAKKMHPQFKKETEIESLKKNERKKEKWLKRRENIPINMIKGMNFFAIVHVWK